MEAVKGEKRLRSTVVSEVRKKATDNLSSYKHQADLDIKVCDRMCTIKV